MAEQIRLDKYLGEMGVGTRSQMKEMAKKGRITVNGTPEKKTDRKVIPGQDVIAVDGSLVSYTSMEYYMLNKPQGVVSATEDVRFETVIDLIRDRQRKDLFPVGRLDKDTEGLLFITNDGELAHSLLSPKKHVDKVYFAWIEGSLPSDAAEQMEKGMVLSDGTVLKPAHLSVLTREEGLMEASTELESVRPVCLTIREGKFHQVKRMFETLDCRVVYLKRVSMGPVSLDKSLGPGEYRPLTNEEVEALKKAGGITC